MKQKDVLPRSGGALVLCVQTSKDSVSALPVYSV